MPGRYILRSTAVAIGSLSSMIAELLWPGGWIDFEDQDKAHEAQSLLLTMTTGVMDVNLALLLFDSARQMENARHKARLENRPEFGQQDERRVRLRQIEDEMLAAASGDGTTPEEGWNLRQEIRIRAEIQFKREKWSSGEPPSGLLQREMALHARSVVYGIDRVWKTLEVLAKSPVPSDAKKARDELKAHLPHLIGVRDTAHHQEDRALGVDRKGKPLATPPIDSPLVRAPGGGVIMLDSFNGDRYTCTLEDGSLGEVPINLESLMAVQKAVQRTLDSMKWTGLPIHYPSDY